MSQPAPLARRLGTWDAVVIGLGSMLGAGVFAAFAPAARAAGSAMLVGLLLAALVAYANATASAQLAAQYPTSGGTYVYGRARLGPWWGYLAGWAFLVGKTASCAAMALTVAAYAVPAGWARPVAVAVVVALGAVNYLGVTRTALVTKVLVAVVVLALVTVVSVGAGDARWATVAPVPADGGWYGVLQSAGLLFFAFAGYARIATMAEEVRDPERTIPRAIGIALGLTVVLYAAVAVTLLATLGAAGTAEAAAPLAAVVAGNPAAAVVVRVGAVAASLGALVALMAGIGRTALAMAREGDLPRRLAAVHPRHRVPHRAEVALAVVVCALVISIDLRGAIGLSSVGVLVYYLVANLAAWTQTAPHRRSPRALQMFGALACVALVATLPRASLLAALAVLAVGVVVRLALHRAASAGRGG